MWLEIMKYKLVKDLQQLTDEIFDRACVKYYSNCYKCPFGKINEYTFSDGEYDCIVQQFDECLASIAKEQKISDFKTANEEYFNSKLKRRDLVLEKFKLEKFESICEHCKNNEECFVKMSTIKECAFFNKVW